MPDSIPPASQMIRVPTPLIDAVKQLSRLHRSGHTRAVLTGLQQLIADIDGSIDSSTVGDSSIESELITRLISEQLEPIQKRLSQLEEVVMLGESVA